MEEKSFILEPSFKHRSECVLSNIRPFFEVFPFLLVHIGAVKMIMPIGLKELGQLSVYFINTKPFHLNSEVINIMVIVLGNNTGTGSSTVAL
jgi:hypothetical protein